MYRLWDIDEDGNLIIDVQEIKLINAFKDLWTLRYKTKGDTQGTRKFYNTALFIYIWYMEDFRSPYIDLPEEKRHTKTVANTEIGRLLKKNGVELKEWKPEKEVALARKVYNDVMYSTDVHILKALKTGLYSSKLIIDFCNRKVQRLIEMEEKGENPDADTLLAALKAIEDINDLSTKLPKSIESIEAYEAKVIAKVKNTKLAKGGHEIGNRADPKRQMKSDDELDDAA